MRNLLGNAWKYTARTAAPNIHVYAETKGGAPRICVADNGSGFDMAHAGRLFKAFARLHRISVLLNAAQLAALTAAALSLAR